MENWRYKACLASGIFLTASLAFPVFAQDSSAVRPEPATLRTPTASAAAPKPRQKKVWTEDSISEVRTPADTYHDQKAAAEAATKTTLDKTTGAAPKANKGLGAPPLAFYIPKSAEETQQAIDKRKDLTINLNGMLSNAQERLQTETDPVIRATLQEKANLLSGDLKSINAELKTLEKALDDYHQGRNPELSKAEGPANSPEKGKPATQSTASAVD